jgi:REP element-mobilizing transposase RayT
MGHSYPCIYLHIIFSTKGRQALIDRDRHRLLCRYLTGIAKNHGMKAIAAGGMPDHMHVLLSLSAEMPAAKAVNLLKSNSSRWMRENDRGLAWQQGYAAFSVSASALESVTQYIAHQEDHHKKRDFAQEYVALLTKHGVQYDPVWVLD